MKYVPPSLLAEWTQKDPIALFEAHLLSRGLASQTDLDSVRVMIDRSLEADLAFAEASPFPLPEQATDDVFAA